MIDMHLSGSQTLPHRNFFGINRFFNYTGLPMVVCSASPLRSLALDCEASTFRGGRRVPRECTIACLTERRLILFQGIQRKSHLQSRTTAKQTNSKTKALIRHNSYQINSTFLSPMIPLNEHSSSSNFYTTVVVFKSLLVGVIPLSSLRLTDRWASCAYKQVRPPGRNEPRPSKFS